MTCLRRGHPLSPANPSSPFVLRQPSRRREPGDYLRSMERTLFDDDHELFRDSVRGFIAKELAPHHEEWERAGVVDSELFRKAGAQGFMGLDRKSVVWGRGVSVRVNIVGRGSIKNKKK